MNHQWKNVVICCIRWILFLFALIMLFACVGAKTIFGVICYAVIAFLVIPVNKLPGKLDAFLGAGKRRGITVAVALILGIAGFVAIGLFGDSEVKSDRNSLTTTTQMTTTTEQTTTELTTTETTATTTTTTTTTITSTTTTTVTTTTAATTTTVPETTTMAPVVTDPPATNPPAADPPAENNSRIVYVTPTGKRYHYDNHCNGGSYYESTLDDALSRGLTPCKKCAGG